MNLLQKMIPLTKSYASAAMKRSFITLAERYDFEGAVPTRTFAKAFAKSVGMPCGLCVNSCTNALIMCLFALKIQKGERVMVPAYTCKAILDAITFLGIIPVFIDNAVDYENSNFNLDENDCMRKLVPGIKAIILPYMFGFVPRYKKLEKLSIPIIEDITLSLGAKIENFYTRKRIIVSSFHSSKMISSLEGGIIATNDNNLYAKLLRMYDVPQMNKEDRIKDASVITYEMSFSFRPSELNFVWGHLQLLSLKRFIQERQKIAAYYIKKLDRTKYIVPEFRKENVYFRFIIGVRSKQVRGLLSYLESKGIEGGRGVFPPLTTYCKSKEVLPGAEKASAMSLSVPLYPGLKQKEMEKIVHVLNEYES